MINILVVGIGNFGSWWVISLTKINSPLKIYCFDKDLSKYKVLKDRLGKYQAHSQDKHKIHFLSELSDAPTLILMFIMLVIFAIGGLLSRE